MALSKKEIEAFTSSDNQNWETPPYIFNDLHRRFKFTVDGAANHKNHLLPNYWNDSLDKNWNRSRVFLNPPYGDLVPAFAEKCALSKGLVVAILPSRTGTTWFQENVLMQALVFYVQGRIRFWLNGKEPLDNDGKKKSPLFDSVIAIYNHPIQKVGTGRYLKPLRVPYKRTLQYSPGVLQLIRGRRRTQLL